MTATETVFVFKLLDSLCNLSNFQYHFQPTQNLMSQIGHFNAKLPHKPANSVPNSHFLLFLVAHST